MNRARVGLAVAVAAATLLGVSAKPGHATAQATLITTARTNAFRVSADASVVVVQSDLMPGDQYPATHLYAFRRGESTPIRVDATSSGDQLVNGALNFELSSNGRYVAFQAYATPQVSPSCASGPCVYRKDLVTGELRVANMDHAGNVGGIATAPSISGDGRFVTFAGSGYVDRAMTPPATHVPGFSSYHVVRKDFVTGDLDPVSATANDVWSNGGSYAGISSNNAASLRVVSNDGRYVAFMSIGSNLVPGDTNGDVDTFVKDMVTGEVVRVGVVGSVQPTSVGLGSIAEDGSWVHVSVNYPDGTLPSGDYLWRRATGAMQPLGMLVPVDGTRLIYPPVAFTSDGSYEAFSVEALRGERYDYGLAVRNIATGQAQFVDALFPGNVANQNMFGMSGDGRTFVALLTNRNSIADPAVPGGLYWIDGASPIGPTLTAPGAPSDVVVSSSAYGEALVWWTAPASTGGSAIVRYDVSGDASCTSTSATECVLRDLVPGSTISVSVTATNAVGTSVASPSATFVVPRDVMPPTIDSSVVPSGPDGLAGWYRTRPTVNFVCADAESGVDTCSAPVLVGEGGNQTVTGVATDRAGNRSEAVVQLSVDAVAPIVTINGVVSGSTYLWGTSPTPSCSATDATSGLGSPCTVVVSGASASGAGSITATASASDKAGNVGTTSVSYTVLSGQASLSALVVQLQGLSLSGNDAKNREKAVESLLKATSSSGWWTNGSPSLSGGASVFNELHDAVQSLGKISGSSGASSVGGSLLAIARGWAVDAIAAQSGVGSAQRVAQAQQQLALGDVKAVQNNPGDAVDAYRQAWKTAWKA